LALDRIRKGSNLGETEDCLEQFDFDSAFFLKFIRQNATFLKKSPRSSMAAASGIENMYNGHERYPFHRECGELVHALCGIRGVRYVVPNVRSQQTMQRFESCRE
jgi:hypothetical protein